MKLCNYDSKIVCTWQIQLSGLKLSKNVFDCVLTCHKVWLIRLKRRKRYFVNFWLNNFEVLGRFKLFLEMVSGQLKSRGLIKCFTPVLLDVLPFLLFFLSIQRFLSLRRYLLEVLVSDQYIFGSCSSSRLCQIETGLCCCFNLEGN